MPLQLLKGIRHFKNHQLKEEGDLYASLSKGQSPDVLFLTCSDSRLSPHSFTHSGLGVLFIGRNPGNIVPPYPDASMPSGEASTIEFALTHLKSKEIIICGHSHCGAMKGLLTPDLKEELPHTAAWLSHASDLVDKLELRHPDIIKDPSLKMMYLTQDNVLKQMEHLKTHPAVKKRLAEGTLKIHGWYYEIEKGEVHIYNPQKNTFVSFEQTVEEIATEKLRFVAQQEAMGYLMSLSDPKSLEEYTALVQIYHKVRFTGISPVWEHIKTRVISQLHLQIGELYITDNGGVNPLFDELIKKGPSIRLENLDDIYHSIQVSPFRAALTLSGYPYSFYHAPLETDKHCELPRARL
jgi:carbonic anhydrase